MHIIGIELHDNNFTGLDLAHPEQGNPGIGGSEYLFVMLATYLKKYYGDKYRVRIYHYSENILPEGTEGVMVSSEDDLLERLKTDKTEVFIHHVNRDLSWYEKITATGVADIPWAHNYIHYPEARAIVSCGNVKRVIFVGREEYDSYMDDDIIRKSAFIFNMMNTAECLGERKSDFGKNVTYVGSLVPAKNFHLLAKVWPQILEKVPDAGLRVIGTGRLYSRNAELGKFGIAESGYEDSFMRYLTDSEGNILKNVEFCGLLDNAGRKRIFADTAVGVVNPAASDETFCLSAVEMELHGIPVVSKKKHGLLDTVSHGRTGLLFKNDKEFADSVVKLLQNREFNDKMGKNARDTFKDRFEAADIIKEWDQMLDDVIAGRDARYVKPQGNYSNDGKWIRMMIRALRFGIGLRFIPSISAMKYKLKGV
ncbi:MAG: glycosyltransferase family 4 protein [Lachnospiraceae bacterium]|nr:glycosyltransferase family 4 protein [Lachnospiraceae bacterium]